MIPHSRECLRQIARERTEADKRGERHGAMIEIVGRRLAWSALLTGSRRLGSGIDPIITHVRWLIGWTVGWLLSQQHALEDFANEDGFDAIEAVFVVASTTSQPHEQHIYTESGAGPGMRLLVGQLGRTDTLAWARTAAAAEIEVQACLAEESQRLRKARNEAFVARRTP